MGVSEKRAQEAERERQEVAAKLETSLKANETLKCQ